MWSAMAVTARRTVAKVKSSAMRPRQPEVPNLMGEAAVFAEALMGGYSTRAGSTLKEVTEKAMIRTNGRYRIVLVTCASIAEARRIGRSAVKKRLAACANIFPGSSRFIGGRGKWRGRGRFWW